MSYIILDEDTRCSHEGTVVLRLSLDSRDTREGFVTHVYRNDEQIAAAVDHMIKYQGTRLVEDLR